jgi:hypothetical protein
VEVVANLAIKFSTLQAIHDHLLTGLPYDTLTITFVSEVALFLTSLTGHVGRISDLVLEVRSPLSFVGQ